MKEFIQSELSKVKEPKFKKLALAEILQHFLLQSLYRHNAFKYLTFTGGTALRLLYHTGRYSEDLDFSMTEKSSVKLTSLFTNIQKDFSSQGLCLELFQKEKKVIFKADFRFSKILQDLDLSPLKDQKLTIKVEVDKLPPKGGGKEIMLVTSPVSYTVSVFNLSSLFATKLCAILCRKYTKGRDYFDLMWLLGKNVIPDFTLLNNAIKQIKADHEKITKNNIKEKLSKHLDKVDFKKIKQELERFLIDINELEFINREALKSLLRSY